MEMSEGERCPGCQELHGDWEKVRDGVVAGPDHRGVIDVFECGRCGEKVEQPRL